MKFIYFLLFLAFPLAFPHPRHKSHPKESLLESEAHDSASSHVLRGLKKHKILAHQLPEIATEGLPSTPKALALKNHFGASPNDSPYGPRPTLVRKQVATTYPDGTVRVENQTEIIHLPEGVISECDIALQKHYPLCFNLRTCDLCASNPYCGI